MKAKPLAGTMLGPGGIVLTLLLSISLAHAGEWFGSITGELRYFPNEPLEPIQFEGVNLSLALEPQYAHTWDDGRQVFSFAPFLRLDQHDPERTHADIRELAWVKAADEWEFRIGVRQVFWGVTEFVHLVDIINQTDLVEQPDGEEKLGQPMINLALVRDWGTLDFFVLTGFRERTSPGPKGRPRGSLVVDTDQTYYESSAGDKHVDAAIRWSHSMGDWDLGLYHFYGTSREPRLQLGSKNGEPVLLPFYELIHQTGLDLQYTTEEWLWKLEVLSRDDNTGRYTAATGGFEYTFVGVFDSAVDLGVISEYVFDDRGNAAPTPFENDVIIGTRLAFNDVQSTELLAGVVFDLDSPGRFFTLEASRRLGDSWKLNVEAKFHADLERADPAYGIRNEDYLQLELAWFF